MIKFQNNHLLIPVGNPLIVHHKPTETHNEITVAVVTYAIPINHLFSKGIAEFTPVLMSNAFKVAQGFPGINLRLNRDTHAPAFIFTVKAKTERRGNDVHNQALADKIAIVKANVKAASILRNIIMGNKKVNGIYNYYEKTLEKFTKIDTILSNFERREISYLNKM